MSEANTQVGNFIHEAQKVVPAAGNALDKLPRVPFQTDLKLTREQENKMIDHAFKRYRTISSELGRDQTMASNWWVNQGPMGSAALASQGLLPYQTFMGKRSRFDAMFANDVAWRPYMFGPDNIFYSSNLSVPLVRRITRQMIARAKNAFYGMDPWFSITPAPVQEYDGQDLPSKIEKVQQFMRFKLGETQSDSKWTGGRGIARALILGECPMKTSYVIRDQIFNVEATVLHGPEGPIRASDDNFITEQDQFVDAEDGKGTRVLARTKDAGPEGWTLEPLAPLWAKVPLDRRQVLFEGTKTEPIYYKDFGCPLTATDEQTADTIYHIYDKPVMEFVDLVVKRGMVDDTAPDRILAAQKMLALVKQLDSNSPQPKSAETSQQRPNENNLNSPGIETGGPVSEMIEFYLWFDANGDGIAENIMLICDRNTQAPVFYDHVANVTTDGLRPIKVLRINPVEGRWYGVGICELFESYQSIVDLLVNRWNFSQSRAGRIDFWRPTDTQEGDRDPNLKINWGGTYTAKPGVDVKNILHSAYLTDIKFEQIKMMMEFFLQLAMNESGVANANDAQAAGLESSDLATGILSIQESGDELFRPFIDELRPGLQDVLDREVDVTLANMNPREVFTYLDGNTQGVDQITPDDVRGLKFKAVITLGMQKTQQQLQVAQAVTALVEKFYMLAPAVQERVAPMYRQQINILDPRVDAEQAIQPVPPAPPEQPEPKKSVSVAIKGENLTPEALEEVMREDFDVQSQAVVRPIPQDVGSTEKIGEAAPATPFKAQLGERRNKKAS